MVKEVAEKKHFEIKKLDVLGVGKIFALLCAFIGFVIGLIVLYLVYKISLTPIAQQMPVFSEVSWKQLIVLPFWYLLVFGIFGGITSMILALIYNLIAKTGGLKFSVK
ncbi:MAG: hypothetical protein QXF25_00200 [Candidatus Pacearchaeota archaeon]